MPKKTSRALACALVAGALLSGTNRAEAYCLTSACEGDFPGERCEPATSSDCGTPLFWSTACFGVAVQQEGSNQVDTAAAQDLVRQAFQAWENADCGNGRPAVAVDIFDPVSCDQQEYNQRGGNVNLVAFRDTEWPYMGSGNTLALTTVTYNLDTGEIFDADLEVNSTANIDITTTDDGVVYDLLSILTHEAGHMLGIAHSVDPTATMKVEYEPGDLELRTLAPDDAAAVCAAYPPPDLGTCDATPRHGFKATCGPGPEEDDGCTVSAAESDEGDASWLVLSGVALAMARIRRPKKA